MATLTQAPASLDDLLRTEGKAELVAGRIVTQMPSGDLPSSAAFEIAVKLREHANSTGHGKAYPDGIGYALPAPLPVSGRESFSPDASFYDGVHPVTRMRFMKGLPSLAVEVRSENDYGPSAESDMAEKRADYFTAGTLVVWDVDPLAETIAVYKATTPATPTTFRRGEVADAEPALPGWRLNVDDIFA
jgi:Uma2 family endonuclease